MDNSSPKIWEVRKLRQKKQQCAPIVETATGKVTKYNTRGIHNTIL